MSNGSHIFASRPTGQVFLNDVLNRLTVVAGVTVDFYRQVQPEFAEFRGRYVIEKVFLVDTFDEEPNELGFKPFHRLVTR